MDLNAVCFYFCNSQHLKLQFNNFSLFIVALATAKKSCTIDSQCDLSKGLACISKTCQCKNKEHFWDGNSCGNFSLKIFNFDFDSPLYTFLSHYLRDFFIENYFISRSKILNRIVFSIFFYYQAFRIQKHCIYFKNNFYL